MVLKTLPKMKLQHKVANRARHLLGYYGSNKQWWLKVGSIEDISLKGSFPDHAKSNTLSEEQ